MTLSRITPIAVMLLLTNSAGLAAAANIEYEDDPYKLAFAVVGMIQRQVFGPDENGSDYSCTGEDQSGGGGGQEVSCSYDCKEGHHVEIEVHADDKDATVSGSTSCGTASPHCPHAGSTGGNHCADEEPTAQSQTGATCRGDSDELWDSGLYVKCRSKDIPCTGTCGPVRWCPVTIEPNPPFPRVCVDTIDPPDVCGFVSCSHTVDLCNLTPGTVDDAPCIFLAGTDLWFPTHGAESSAHLWYLDGKAFAASCHDDLCWNVVPQVELHAGDAGISLTLGATL